MKDLVTINKANGFDVELDIRYAGTNNFTGQKIYDQPYSLLHPDAASALKKAIDLAAIQNLRFKIFDAFRPISAQESLFKKFPDGDFISNPKTGLVPHCRGVAIDLTLIDEKGNELNMGTGFDAFVKESNQGSVNISKDAARNRYILLGIMISAGFDVYYPEWWHYHLPNIKDYPVI